MSHRTRSEGKVGHNWPLWFCFGSFHSPPFAGNFLPELPGKTTFEVCLVWGWGWGGGSSLSKWIDNQAFVRVTERLSGRMETRNSAIRPTDSSIWYQIVNIKKAVTIQLEAEPEGLLGNWDSCMRDSGEGVTLPALGDSPGALYWDLFSRGCELAVKRKAFLLESWSLCRVVFWYLAKCLEIRISRECLWASPQEMFPRGKPWLP